MITTKHANWTAPKNITALSTTRLTGFSKEPYNENNLALHVGDNPHLVEKNRDQLIEVLGLPGEPVWLEQTHSTHCIIAEKDSHREADAAITRSHHHPLVILTADCLPITVCNRQGTEIAAIHAGWRGLHHGIIENTLNNMTSQNSDLIAWIGPSICQQCYEVGNEVYESFVSDDPDLNVAFKPMNNKWLANLPRIAEKKLLDHGLNSVFQSDLCTFELKNDFFSYRRASQTGRIGTLIWFNDQPRD